ncbi:uncharacterized protein LAESUDRAFT_70512 [Laetiporus sulphureus 93-53]|uniref:CHAT domain-containing protein n=1 Tax=Laetiporus sulphureus 93-53 TaxID=1314785 RepID=A0A165AWN3_9APHY|nr:uncharacterized protein LAESUDRAFT_70512 [Laetiporus sulphureus 93-53]KZS99797.1 hypothetical protein LAESUDRAFT_70512 [Laetiporus sulphureus 93-53]
MRFRCKEVSIYQCDIKILQDGIQSLRDAVSIVPSVAPQLADHIMSLAASLEVYYADAEQDPSVVSEAMNLYRSAAASPSAPIKIKYNAATGWARTATFCDNPYALDAYETAIGILPQFASLALDVLDRHKAISRLAAGIASDAAACAIHLKQNAKAVEYLEQGRSVFWRQSMQLRTPMTELAERDPDLADRLMELACDLNLSSFRTRQSGHSKARSEFIAREGSKRRALALEWDEKIAAARTMEGYEKFLHSPSYTQLAQAMKHGIIVLLSATASTCHAIILTSDQSEARILPIPAFTDVLARTLAANLHEILKRANGRSRQVDDQRLSGVARHFQSDRDRAASHFNRLLEVLWKNLIKLIVEFLGLQTVPKLPRLIWCCTGSLALLPIHAAGIYSGSNLVSISDFVISSYTPTISNITSENAHFDIVEQGVKVLLTGQTYTPNLPALPNVTVEFEKITAVLQSSGSNAVCTQLTGDHATRNGVLEVLQESHIAHFACHGLTSTDPLSSAIVLNDGDLTVDRLMRTPLTNARLVFLSACQTAQLNPSEPDESIHIAAAMLFAGFNGVVATMWAISDADAPKLAEEFYRQLFQSGSVDFNDTAQCLHDAVKQCRLSGVPPLRWAPFIHMGR